MHTGVLLRQVSRSRARLKGGYGVASTTYTGCSTEKGWSLAKGREGGWELRVIADVPIGTSRQEVGWSPRTV